MKSKIISIRGDYIPESKKQLPLSPLMIVALLAACARQKEGLPFGPCDIKGSCISLIKRGLITRKELIKKDDVVSWQVTNEAIAMLKDAGVEVTC